MKLLSRVRPFATPWTVAYQAPQSMEFSRQEYWSRVPFPTPGDLPNSGIEPVSLASSALADGLFITSAIWEAHIFLSIYLSFQAKTFFQIVRYFQMYLKRDVL